LKLVELHNFFNDIVTDPPHTGGVKSTADPSTTPAGGKPTKKRTYENLLVGASKIWKRNNGAGRSRGRGGLQGGRGRTSQNNGCIDFNAIARTLTLAERKRHIEDGLCFKCHKK
jgi:hypothetical protein